MAEPEKRPWWSVRISGVLRLLVIIYAVLGIPLLVAYGVSFVSNRWMTQNEKRAAMTALRSVEDLKDSAGVADNAWKIKDQKAGQLVERAQQAAFTDKDRGIGEGLSVLLAMIENDRSISKEATLENQVAEPFPKLQLPRNGNAIRGDAKAQFDVDDVQILLNAKLRSELGLYGADGKKK